MNEVRISESSSSYSSNIPLSGMTSGGISVSPPQSTPVSLDNSSFAAGMIGTVAEVLSREKEILRKIENLEQKQQDLEDVLSRQKILNNSFQSLLKILYGTSFLSVGLFCCLTFFAGVIFNEKSVYETYVNVSNALGLLGLLGVAIAIFPCLCAYTHGKKIEDLNNDIETLKKEVNYRLKN